MLLLSAIKLTALFVERFRFELIACPSGKLRMRLSQISGHPGVCHAILQYSKFHLHDGVVSVN